MLSLRFWILNDIHSRHLEICNIACLSPHDLYSANCNFMFLDIDWNNWKTEMGFLCFVLFFTISSHLSNHLLAQGIHLCWIIISRIRYVVPIYSSSNNHQWGHWYPPARATDHSTLPDTKDCKIMRSENFAFLWS